MRREKLTNQEIEASMSGKSKSQEDPVIWFGLDETGHRNARNVHDLARAIRQRDFNEADMCLDLIGRDDNRFAEQVALGRSHA